ncbi:MAG: response regulator [Thiomargarita sp.]|nr:response regulator [Thiomargarita sp.]
MNRLTIVCVDDEQFILNTLKIEIKQTFQEKYLIETAESGEEALELIQELLDDDYEVPLVISDYMMPHIKGDELLRQIHIVSPTTRNVMLTGQADMKAVANAVQYAKLYRYLPKPWSAEDLSLTITEAIKSYLNEQELRSKTKELERKVKTFHKFVPVQFLKLLGLKEFEEIELGACVHKEMTIMFADIRDFTSLSEKLSPQENFQFLNTYLSEMEPIINKYHGFIDKYIGDAIMALFPVQADDAVQAAVSMLKQLVEYNHVRKMNGNRAIKIGIGLHTGPVMLGTVGGENRMDSTVVSDAVNLASRIEGLTKFYKTPLLITADTKSQLIDTYKIRTIDCVTVKGKIKRIQIFEVFDADAPSDMALKSETSLDFEKGIQNFHNEEFEQAQESFEKVLNINKNDKTAAIYFEHCQNIFDMIMPEYPTILIVDDSLINLHLLANVLRDYNFQVLFAENGHIAIEHAKNKQPHLILLDVVMPGIDGFETCRQLKKDVCTQDIPIIFMTALTDIANKMIGFKAGAVDYITKPFEDKEVILRIQTHLKLTHLQKVCQFTNSIKTNNVTLQAKIDQLVRA